MAIIINIFDIQKSIINVQECEIIDLNNLDLKIDGVANIINNEK